MMCSAYQILKMFITTLQINMQNTSYILPSLRRSHHVQYKNMLTFSATQQIPLEEGCTRGKIN